MAYQNYINLLTLKIPISPIYFTQNSTYEAKSLNSSSVGWKTGQNGISSHHGSSLLSLNFISSSGLWNSFSFFLFWCFLTSEFWKFKEWISCSELLFAI
jgi:hypothetical protein